MLSPQAHPLNIFISEEDDLEATPRDVDACPRIPAACDAASESFERCAVASTAARLAHLERELEIEHSLRLAAEARCRERMQEAKAAIGEETQAST